MKSLMIAIALIATPADAGITRWADISCWEGVNTRDNKVFNWIKGDGTKTRCHTFSEVDNGGEKARVMLCDNGTTPMMVLEKDGHIFWNQVEMWNPDTDAAICH